MGRIVVACEGVINQGIGTNPDGCIAFDIKGWAGLFLEGPSVQASNVSIKGSEGGGMYHSEIS